MKRIIPATILALAGLSVTALAALPGGTAAPRFEARASLAGEEFDYSLEEALSAGPVVVYFFPSAYTTGCNIQAREFAVNMDQFKTAGASVIGVSMDSIERLNDFSADPEFCAGQLPVASDADGAIARSFDITIHDPREGMKDTRGEVVDHGFAERTTFVVAADGQIVEVIGGISPSQNVSESLEAVQRLQ